MSLVFFLAFVLSIALIDDGATDHSFDDVDDILVNFVDRNPLIDASHVVVFYDDPFIVVVDVFVDDVLIHFVDDNPSPYRYIC